MRRPTIALLVIIAIAAILAIFYISPSNTKNAPDSSALKTASSSSKELPAPSTVASPTHADGSEPTENLNLATELNAPGATIRKDFEVINSLLAVWQTNFLHEGNPVGENHEITAALTGRNSLHVAFISPKHPAINADGELCDRWGTPFRFHQLSGAKMEIRSAGPDKKFGTSDDAMFTPN